MKKVLCFGTFDIIHPGHIYFLTEAKKRGGFLAVVIARDLTVLKVKGRLPKNDEKTRVLGIEKLGLADQVVLGGGADPYEVIDKIGPDIICLGYDQKKFTDNLEGELLKRKVDCKILRLGALKPEIYKSSKL